MKGEKEEELGNQNPNIGSMKLFQLSLKLDSSHNHQSIFNMLIGDILDLTDISDSINVEFTGILLKVEPPSLTSNWTNFFLNDYTGTIEASLNIQKEHLPLLPQVGDSILISGVTKKRSCYNVQFIKINIFGFRVISQLKELQHSELARKYKAKRIKKMRKNMQTKATGLLREKIGFESAKIVKRQFDDQSGLIEIKTQTLLALYQMINNNLSSGYSKAIFNEESLARHKVFKTYKQKQNLQITSLEKGIRKAIDSFVKMKVIYKVTSENVNNLNSTQPQCFFINASFFSQIEQIILKLIKQKNGIIVQNLNAYVNKELSESLSVYDMFCQVLFISEIVKKLEREFLIYRDGDRVLRIKEKYD